MRSSRSLPSTEHPPPLLFCPRGSWEDGCREYNNGQLHLLPYGLRPPLTIGIDPLAGGHPVQDDLLCRTQRGIGKVAVRRQPQATARQTQLKLSKTGKYIHLVSRACPSPEHPPRHAMVYQEARGIRTCLTCPLGGSPAQWSSREAYPVFAISCFLPK